MDNPIQVGDILVTTIPTEVGRFRILYMKYQNAMIVTDAGSKIGNGIRYQVAECTKGGCETRDIRRHPNGTETWRVVRLASTLPDRENIINNAVKIASLFATRPEFRYPKWSYQFVRSALGFCFKKSPNMSEIKKYYKILEPLMQNPEAETQGKTYGFFCSRFVLLAYQLAVSYAMNGDFTKLKPCFTYNAKKCWPYNIAALSKKRGTNCWESLDIDMFVPLQTLQPCYPNNDRYGRLGAVVSLGLNT